MTKFGLPKDVKFCTRCVISNQRPSSTVEYLHTAKSHKETIFFDEHGVCDACRVAEAKHEIDWQEREQELWALCDQHRSKGAFDCIVPGSGGKDSFYAAHILKYKYDMHPLLVTWAPHMMTDWGFRNLQRMQAVSDHILYTPCRDTHRLLTRLAVDNLLHPFQPFIIGQKTIAVKTSELYGIDLIFYGENEAEYGNPKHENLKPMRSDSYHTGGLQNYLSGIPAKELFDKHGLESCDLDAYLPDKVDQFIEVHYLGYYLKWKPQEAYYYAVQNGGFECSPERTPGTWSKYSSIDDKMDDLHYYTTFIKFGIGRATYDAAQEIRSGDIDRDEGVALVQKYDGEYPTRFEKEIFEYLSVPGFSKMTRKTFLELCESFKPPHLWDGDKLKYEVE